MNPQMKRVLRTLLIFIPGLYLMTSLITHCTGSSGGTSVCTNTVSTSDSSTCETYAADNNCGNFDFNNGTCTANDCLVCTCSGTVSVSTQSACSQYAEDFNCSSSSFTGSVCTVQGCTNCDIVVDDTDDDYIIDVDDASFDDV